MFSNCIHTVTDTQHACVACIDVRSMSAFLTDSDEDEVTSPAKPAASTIPPVDMARHPYGYYIMPHSMHLLQSGQGIDDETINLVLGLLQLAAQL